MSRIQAQSTQCYSHSAHRRDVESEQATTNDRNGGDAVDVADLVHHVGQPLMFLDKEGRNDPKNKEATKENRQVGE